MGNHAVSIAIPNFQTVGRRQWCVEWLVQGWPGTLIHIYRCNGPTVVYDYSDMYEIHVFISFCVLVAGDGWS